jgi:hypothetical protein
MIFHIRTENVLRKEQGSSKRDRTSEWTEARRGNEAEAWKSRTESLDSASKLNRNMIGTACNPGR